MLNSPLAYQVLSFLQPKEKTLMERFVKAQEIRRIKKSLHRSIENSRLRHRENFYMSSERVRQLEHTLRSIEKIKEQQRAVNDLYKSKEKINFKLRDDIKKGLFGVNISSKNKYFNKNDLFPVSNTSESPIFLRLNALPEGLSTTPAIEKRRIVPSKLLKTRTPLPNVNP